jgi:hypothetical protein
MWMHSRTRWGVALGLVLGLGAVSEARTLGDDGVKALHGEWIFVEDRTEGRAVEQQQPSMSSKVVLRVEADAVVLVRRDFEVRMALDGSPSEVENEGRISRYSGAWKDGAFAYTIESLRGQEKTVSGLIKTALRPSADGLLAHVVVESPVQFESLALYRHPDDIELPKPASATIDDVAWIAGAWVGTAGQNGSRSIEERWSPPAGGWMLATSRTVSRNRVVAFEYLRIAEKDGGLVYVAQPNGKTATEFVLTEVSATRAVFENPRHDSPQRIVYELSEEGELTASVGYRTGGKPARFAFTRETP